MSELSAKKPAVECCTRQKTFLCWRICMMYAVLTGIGIPWYWPEDHALQLLGMPAWTCVSLLASLGASLLTTWLILTHWPSECEDGNEPSSDPS
jgi:hypothetical protein